MYIILAILSGLVVLTTIMLFLTIRINQDLDEISSSQIDIMKTQNDIMESQIDILKTQRDLIQSQRDICETHRKMYEYFEYIIKAIGGEEDDWQGPDQVD